MIKALARPDLSAGLLGPNGRPVQLGYNAIQEKGRRQAPRSAITSEDQVLTAANRRKIIATSKDIPRNFSILAWMIRRHLDYVSRFDLHLRTGAPAVDKRVTQLFTKHGRRESFDIAGRHDRNAFMRVFEAAKTVDGDCLWLKLSGLKSQGIEADLIAKPGDLDKVPGAYRDKVSDLGLVLDDYLKTLFYCVCNRGENSASIRNFSRLVPADQAIFDGYFSRFSQTRGITLFAPVLNMAQDISETLEWVGLKAKLHALFGLAFKRESPEGMRWNKEGYADSTDNETTGKNPYEVNITPKGIFTLDLEPGDSVEPVESKTPSTELLGFTREEIRMVLLALDIPFTAYDSLQSSFSARVADRQEYEESAEEKRRKNADCLRQYSDWCLADWSASDEILASAMAAAGVTVDDIAEKLVWIPAGTPWLDKRNEIAGDRDAIGLGVDSAPRVARRRGLDAFQIIDEQAEFLAYAKEKGVPVYVAAPGQASTAKDTDGTAPAEPAAAEPAAADAPRTGGTESQGGPDNAR